MSLELKLNYEIATILSYHIEKLEKLLTLQDITRNYTSDDGIEVKCELYNGYTRYLLEGCRCNMILCFDVNSKELKRKKRNDIPEFIKTYYTNISDILMLYEKIETNKLFNYL